MAWRIAEPATRSCRAARGGSFHRRLGAYPGRSAGGGPPLPTHATSTTRTRITIGTSRIIRATGPSLGGVPSSPAFSAIVVDANSGRTLYCVAEDGLRHPASITKVMTLYLLFEQLEKGAMTLQTRIPISEHAAAQEPSKLGVEPGETISVEDAIKAVVTRSANDMAVAIAEAIGSDESSFAEMMTRKAHALGMSNTIYRNASGLPNDKQITTARDLTILARSLEDRFPRYFKYFSTQRVRIRRTDDRQSQSPARPRRRRRRHQDRLHPRLGLQSPDLGPPGRTVADRRRHGRPHRGSARPDDGEPDRRPYRAGLDRPHRDPGRRRVGRRRSAGQAAVAASAARDRVRSWSPRTFRTVADRADASTAEGDDAEDDGQPTLTRLGRPAAQLCPLARTAPAAAGAQRRSSRRPLSSRPSAPAFRPCEAPASGRSAGSTRLGRRARTRPKGAARQAQGRRRPRRRPR